MSDEDAELSERQAQVVALLREEPLDKYELSDKLAIGENTVKTHIEAAREKGAPIGWDAEAGAYYVEQTDDVRRVSTQHKAQITRTANEWATEQEAAIIRRLRGGEPLVATPEHENGNATLFVATGDWHFGDVVERDTPTGSVDVFNSEIAKKSVDHFTQRVIQRARELPYEFDNVVLVWIGDMITNEAIYDGQSFNLDATLPDQLSTAVGAATRQAKTLADEFGHVTIVAQPGNHGKSRADGTSKQANMDLLMYRWVRDRLRESLYSDQVRFIQADAQPYANFEVRGWRCHLRHGQNTQTHVDATSASQADWRGWRDHHRYDMGIRGHHHVYRKESVLNQYPVVTSPSMKPGGDFAEKIGSPDCSTKRKMGVVWAVTDERPMEWERAIDDTGMDAFSHVREAMQSDGVPKVEA